MERHDTPLLLQALSRREFLRVVAGGALAAGGLHGCGGGGGNGGGGGGGGDEITDASRSAAITGVETRFSELLGQGLARDQVNQTMASFMAANPLFEETGVSDDSCAWGRFKDGRLLVVVNNRSPEPVTDPDADALRSPSTRAGAELPSSTDARLMHSFGPNFDQLQRPVDDIAAYLRAHGYQIQPGTEGDARLGTLRGVSNAGFFYLNTHGGSGKLKGGFQTFLMSSSTLKTDANENIPEIKRDWDNQRIGYMTMPNGNTLPNGQPETDTRYGITAAFVTAYMSFAPRSVLFFNVCFSADTSMPGVQAFINACHGKGAGVYLGWTKLLSANPAFRAVRFFVDRMLGHNKKEPYVPKQRPFAYDEVLADMKQRHGYGVDSSTGAALVAKPNSAYLQPEILAPSIQYMLVNEVGRKLVLKGLFGTEKPVVTIGGQPVNVSRWGPDELEVDLADDGVASKGDVVVDSQGRKSNVRRLTEWIIGMAFEFHADRSSDLKVSGSLFVRFRADVGEYREKPHLDPKKPMRAAMGTRDTQANLAGSGTRRDDEHCVTTCGGQQMFRMPGYSQTLQWYLAARFKVDVNTMKGAIGLDLGTLVYPPPFFFRTDCEAWTDEDGNLHPATSDQQDFMVSLGELYGQDTFPDPGERPGVAPIPLNAIQFTFGPNFVIPAGVVEDLATGIMRLEWTAVTPSFPPDPAAARSAVVDTPPAPIHRVNRRRAQ